MPNSESDGLLSQDDINAALAAAGLAGELGKPAEVAAAAEDGSRDSARRPDDEAASAMAAAIAAESSSSSPPPSSNAARFEIPELERQEMSPDQVNGIDLLRDVELNVKIELGRSRMLVDDVLRLGEGSVVELDKLAGDPVDVFVNNRLVARGEVLVLNDNFCVRISDILSREPSEGW